MSKSYPTMLLTPANFGRQVEDMGACARKGMVG